MLSNENRMPVARKNSVLTEFIDIFTQACKVCIYDEDVAETDFELTFETPKEFRSGLENLALRQQLAIWKRHKKRPQIRTKDLSLENISSLLNLLTFPYRPATFASMMKMLLKLILNILLRSQKDYDLALENLALCQQLAI